MNKPQAHVNQGKKQEIKELQELLTKKHIVGLVDMTNMPALQLQRMKKQLVNDVTIRMSKKRLIKIALQEASKEVSGLEKLIPYVRGMPALIITDNNPFALAKILKKSRSKAPAKSGQVAPNDITVPAGPTSFTPGPIIGELGSIGIKAGIDAGKVIIKEDAVVVKEGNVISERVAGLLTRLGIEPMEIGLNLTGVCENGVIFEKKVLEIDEKAFLDNVKKAALDAFKLGIGLCYPTKDTIAHLLAKAHREGTVLADEQNILTSDNTGKLLSKAERQMLAIKEKVGGA